MEEQVRRFRVKININRLGVMAGDIGEYVRNGADVGCYWLKNAKWRYEGVWHFEPHELEELPAFDDTEEWDGSKWVAKKPKTLANFGKMHGESEPKCKCNCHCCNKPTYRPYKPGEVKCGDVFVRIDNGCQLMVTAVASDGSVCMNGWDESRGWKYPKTLLAEYTKPDGSPAGILE